ncbi:MAG: dehydrogenase, partial [bacterium]|nr:dehydrogenase [bacterium]
MSSERQHRGRQLPLPFIVIMLLCGALCEWATAEEPIEPFSPELAAETMVVPKGFRAQLFASEPMVRQPVSFCLDDRGRMWIAEAYNFPFRDKEPQDRIVILEDTTGDGKADKQTLFHDKLGYVTGIEVGFGGVWVMSPPEMLFIPDRNQDDKPDSAPKVLLDGFGLNSAHNIANGFTWGPDGWLYAGHGRTSPSDVGPPGTKKEDRIHHDGGVFRYHPEKHLFENFCDGSTNPWGVAFDDYGQAFISNCVNPHLFHAVQGGHFEPWRGRKSSQYAFERLPTIADHLHWKGEIAGDSDEVLAAGGGHAHCGTMVYLGDNWPDRYRNTIFMGNVHGRRINNDSLKRSGSGYIASHQRDVMIAKDPWFKAVTIQLGPGGEVYISDWSDTGECHDYRNTHRETGRLFTLSYGDFKPQKVDFAAKSNDELAQLQLHKNDWKVTHARRLLQERTIAGDDMKSVHAALLKIFNTNDDPTRKLRAMWALHVTGGTNQAFLAKSLRHQNEYVRAWAVRLLTEFETVTPETLTMFTDMAAYDASPFVRLHLASAAIRLPLAQRWPIIEKLAMHAEDADDPQLPLMIWYGLEPLVSVDTERSLKLLKVLRIAKLRDFIVRRAASGKSAQERIGVIATLLSEPQPIDLQEDILKGVLSAIRGRTDLKAPSTWSTARDELARSQSNDVRQLAQQVGLWLRDEEALHAQRELVADQRANKRARQSAITELLNLKDAALPPLLFQLLDEDAHRATAIRGLARYDHPETPSRILERYQQLSASERQEALLTLSSRPQYAIELLNAVQKQTVDRRDFTSPTVRQLRQLKSKPLQTQLTLIWGVVGKESKDKLAEIARYKKLLGKDFVAKSDLSRGRALFVKTCNNCHQLFGEGGKIGPEITGANRSNIDYLLENILDPNALVPKIYQLTLIETANGRILTGLVVEETEQVVTLQTTNEVILL